MNEFMELALREAQIAAEEGEIPVGAVIVSDGRVVASAHNTSEKSRCALCHAETLAIQKASETLDRWRLSDCTMYVTMEPCPMCAGAIVNARIKSVICGVKDANMGAFGSVLNLSAYPLTCRPDCRFGEGESEAKEVLQSFFKRKRSKT